MSRRWPLALPVVLAVLVLARLGLLWAARVGYPFDLEWMEGGMLVHAWRLAHGLPLYPEPGRDFVPYIYPPGYSAVVAAIGMATGGVGYLGARLVSLAGALAAAAAIVRIVRQDGGGWLWGLLGGTFFLGCYEFSGAFYDLVRPDGLAIGLLAWSLAFALDRRRGSVAASGLLLAAAFVVKQHSAAFGLPMVLGIGLRDGWRGAARFAAWSALPALVALGVLQVTSEGRYLVYVIQVPATHGVVGRRVFPVTPRELAHAMYFALPVASVFLLDRLVPGGERPWIRFAVAAAVVVLAGVAGMWLPKEGGNLRWHPAVLASVGIGSLAVGAGAVVLALSVPAWRRRLSWRAVTGIGFAAVTVGVVASMRGHVGGFINVLMPAHWVIALGAAVALSRWDRASTRLARTALVALLAAAQLAWHAADLWGYGGRPERNVEASGWRAWVARDALVPSAEDREAGEAVVALLAEQPGPVWSPVAPWLAQQAGHEPGMHLIALWDIDRKDAPMQYGVVDVRAALAEGYWATVVDGTRPIKYGIERTYEVGETLPVPRGAFMPRSGWPNRPARLLVPRSRRDGARP